MAFAALLDELDVSRRPSLAITMRTQRLALELFEKHLPGFHQRAAVSCDVLTYLLHLLTRLCYRNWDVESLAASMVSRRVRPVDLEAVFASSGDEGGAAGAHHGRDPFGSGKPPYVNAEALGLDDACSLPIRAQQEELQRAGRRVAAFLARVLQTDAGGAEHGDGLGHSHGGGGGGGLGLLKKASTLGNSSACASTGSSFHSAVLHVTGAPSAMPTTATVPAPSLVQLTSEQRRVVSEGFAFLYHSCRGQPDLLQGTALPILHVLRAYAPEFPYAMRLLAALARGTGRAAGLGIQDVDVLLTRCIGGGGGDGAGLSPEMQTEALGLVRAVLEAEGGAAAAWSPEGGYEGEGDHQYHRQYTVSSGPSRPAHAPDRELWALKAAVLEAVWRRLLLGDDGSAGGDGGAAVDFSLAAMALVETPRSSSKRKHPQQPSSAASSSSSSPTSWRLPQASLAARDWAFKAEGLALVRACLEAAAQLERAQTIAEEELDVEGPSPVFDSVLGRGGSVGATMATADSPAPLKLDAVQGVKERVAVLYPPEDCLAAAMDAHMPLPVRTLLLRLVKLQAFVATDRPRAPAPPALSDEASGSSSSSRASSRLSPAHHHGGAHPHPARPAAASPPPPPLEEVGARLAAAAAASTRTFELMQTFAGRCQLEVEAFRRSIRLGMVTMKEMEGMAALPYLVKAVPAFVLAFLRRQGCGPDVQEALQLSLASARRKLEKEQGRSRLWKATEGVLPQKVAKALLMDGSGEEVMAWIVDTFVHTGHHHDRRGRAAGLAAADGASSTDVSVSGHPTALGRVASSMALHGGMVSKQSSGRSLLQQLHSQFPVSAPAIHHQQQQPPQSQPQEPEPASLQLKVLGQMLGLIERLAGLVLCVPALQAQWASAPEPVAQSLLVLLAFGAMAERVYHMRGSPQQLAALAMGRAPSRVSDGAGAGARGFYRKGTLDGSTASRGKQW